MTEETFKLIIGLLLAASGLLIILYGWKNNQQKEISESTKSANSQLIILGIGLIIGGLFFAF